MATGPGPALTEEAFAANMAALRPFESNPEIAVACSGGPDSMALTVLADRWARDCGGKVTALIVDHGLRADAAAEARRVKGWLKGAGIVSVILRREGERPSSDIQAAARRARYELLNGWCRRNGVLHLLLGHHLQDQAETLLLRLARGSGVDGLSAMAPVREAPETRLLRPLLEIPREWLVACLEEAQRPFVRDPSNEDRSFARVRMRDLMPRLDEEGMTPQRLADTARRMARASAALEAAADDMLAAAAAIYPEGYAMVRRGAFRYAAEETALRTLARLLCCVGGNEYGPRLERLEGLYRWLLGGVETGSGRTLAGCRIMRRRDGILICREAAAMQGVIDAGDDTVWDNRFRLSVSGWRGPESLRIGPLGRDGWKEMAALVPDLRSNRMPAPVRWTLPVIRVLDEIVAVPHLNYLRTGHRSRLAPDVELSFLPARTLTKSRAFKRTGFT